MNSNHHTKNNQLKSMNQRSGRARIAEETLAILKQGSTSTNTIAGYRLMKM